MNIGILDDIKTDFIVFVLVEAILTLLFIFVIAKDISIRRKSKRPGIKAEVTRCNESMNALYVNFGIVTVVFTLVTQVCDELKGNQVLVIVINYAMLTYMFFFSTWFRNGIFFRLFNRIKRD
ncbi:MAG: hypothetical protein JRI77_00920 [Deltaproteobacteria bacterium]|nr:hypothetical protein [Deltaproteobacteria bacterium]